MGWGQVAQHRASGHKGGLGVTGLMKHHYSTMLKEYPDHYGHPSTHPPHPNITKKWASIRELDDLFKKFGKEFKVLRGNGFQKGGHYFLEAYRYAFYRTEAKPDEYFENVGFRCVMPATPPK